MLIDYHLHTARCGHAGGKMEEYLLVARQRGLAEVGFADHFPLYFQTREEREPGLAMDESELEDYMADVRRLQQAFPDLTIKLGVEADYIPGWEDRLRALLKDFPFDYVLGSVHFLDGWGFDNPDLVDEYKNRDIDRLYQRYFELLKQAALSGVFDVLAHPDLIKKFGFYPEADLTEVYIDTISAIKESGVCIEVNTAGLRVPAREIYPAEGFLRLCCEKGVSVTLGSDAHWPEQVGMDFAQALALLKRVGYREIVQFQGRRKKLIEIDAP